MNTTCKLLFSALLSACLPAVGHAASATNKSFQGKFKTTAQFCTEGQCDEQAENVTSAFFVGDRGVHVYEGANKGMLLPFGKKNVSADGKSVWVLPTSTGFDESYARDGFVITHHYAMRPDGTCAVSVSVPKAPAGMKTTYKTDMESCKVADGNVFAAK